MNRTSNPIVIDLDNDPGEKYKIESGPKFREAMELVMPHVDLHRATMVKG